MSNLSAFLSPNALKVENVKHVASKRFVQDGKPVEWEIRTLLSGEEEAIRKECTRRIAVPGRKNQFTQEFDSHKYGAKLSVQSTVFPNLNDAALQDSYGVQGAEALIKTMLTSGEFVHYYNKVQEVNGLTETAEDQVEEAKN